MGISQSTKLQERRRVRHRLAIDVDPDEGADGLPAVDRVVNAFIRKAKTLLGNTRSVRATPTGGRSAPSSFG